MMTVGTSFVSKQPLSQEPWYPLVVFTRGGQETAAMVDLDRPTTPKGLVRIFVNYAGSAVILAVPARDLRPPRHCAEVVRLFLLPSYTPTLWYRRDGSRIPIRRMDDEHLNNAIAMLERRRTVLQMERARRQLERRD